VYAGRLRSLLLAGLVLVARVARADDPPVAMAPGTYGDPAHELELSPSFLLVPGDDVPTGIAIRDADPSRVKIFVDGFEVPPFGYEQRAVVGGDSTSAAIAAASVLAKVTRDRYMRRAAERHPEWDFETNVGYSTPEHRAAIAAHGVSPLHRLSFASIAYQQLALGG